MPKPFNSIKNEIKFSLKTKSLTEARRRARNHTATVIQLQTMSDLEKLKQQLQAAGIDTDAISGLKIKDLKIGNVEIREMEVDPTKEGDTEAATDFIKAAIESQHGNDSNLGFGTAEDSSERHMLDDVIQLYVAEKKAAGDWVMQSQYEYTSLFELLTTITGNIYVDEVSAGTARDVKEKLVKLPPNFKAVGKYKGLSIDEIIIASGSKQQKSTTTINKQINRISSLFDWLYYHSYIKNNYFKNITIKQRRNNDREDRLPFTDHEVKLIFRSVMGEKGFKYWTPWIALHTGMRRDEIVTLKLDSIKQENAIWYFDLTERDGKTSNAKRRIPIHSRLIDLGILDYVDKLKKKGKSDFFPELIENKKPDSKKLYNYGRPVSRWFSSLKNSLILTDGHKKSFHSLRHNFATRLQEAELDENRVAALLGHTVGKRESFMRYASGYKLETMKKDIELITFDIDTL